MGVVMIHQFSLFPALTAEFPSTRYQGSKAKLVDWIWKSIEHLEFQTCLDAFGGTGAVAYRLKRENKRVTYNDALKFNFLIGQALIENNYSQLPESTINWLCQRHVDLHYPAFVEQTFHDIYFTDEENRWIDQTITNIRQLNDPYQHALAFFALAQACIVKRPYNLFHRKNLYLRFAEVQRSFGNKASWDKSFETWFRLCIDEANRAVFDNGQTNSALNHDVLEIPPEYDLVYIDPPYISGRGVATDYRDFYHFLEGLTIYDLWGEQIDYRSKHRRLKRQPSIWTDKTQIVDAFDRLFAHFKDSILVVSYRTDGIPSIATLVELLSRYKQHVAVEHYGKYQYVLSTNQHSGEMLLIGT